MTVISVYSRQGCHLCEVLIEELMPLARGVARVEVHDVDSREDWQARYGDRIPVVEVAGDYVCHYRLDREALLSRLGPGGAEDGTDA